MAYYPTMPLSDLLPTTEMLPFGTRPVPTVFDHLAQMKQEARHWLGFNV